MKNHDEQLDKLFRSLPREEADDYFSARVLNRLVISKTNRGAGRGKYALVGVGVTLAVAVMVALPVLKKGEENSRHDLERRALLEELADIRVEHTALAGQVATMENSDKEIPVYYLGGNDQKDFILDIRKIRMSDTKPNRAGAWPANISASRESMRTGRQFPTPAVYQGGSI